MLMPWPKAREDVAGLRDMIPRSTTHLPSVMDAAITPSRTRRRPGPAAVPAEAGQTTAVPTPHHGRSPAIAGIWTDTTQPSEYLDRNNEVHEWDAIETGPATWHGPALSRFVSIGILSCAADTIIWRRFYPSILAVFGSGTRQRTFLPVAIHATTPVGFAWADPGTLHWVPFHQ